MEAGTSVSELQRHCSYIQDGNEKAKVEVELEWGRDVKGNKMSFWKFINSGRKAEENMYLQLNGQGNLMISDTEEIEVLSVLFCLCYQASQVPESTSGGHGSEMIQTAGST